MDPCGKDAISRFLPSKIAAWILAALLLHTDASIAESPQLPAAKQLNELKSSIDTLRNKVSTTQQQKQRSEELLRAIELRINHLSRALTENQQKTAELKRALEKLRQSQTKNSAILMENKDFLSKQLTASYALGQSEPIRLLLNLDNSATLGRTLTYYRYAQEARATRIRNIQNVLDSQQKTASAIAAEQKQLATLTSQALRQQKQLKNSRQERQTLIAKLDHQLSHDESRLSDLLADQEQLQRTLRELTESRRATLPSKGHSKKFSRRKGQLPWPASGPLIHQYGERRQTGNMRWRGWLIGAKPGSDVIAVAPGKVVFANWLRGFGLLLIIDHSDGFLSLYGHNETLLKDVGEHVDQGEVVASVGSSGGRQTEGLYFELRHAGKPVNPEDWLGDTG